MASQNTGLAGTILPLDTLSPLTRLRREFLHACSVREYPPVAQAHTEAHSKVSPSILPSSSSHIPLIRVGYSPERHFAYRPPSAKLCCHPVQRNAATFGDHQGCARLIRIYSSLPRYTQSLGPLFEDADAGARFFADALHAHNLHL